MNVLLLGGTGAMGKHLAKILADKGVSVYVTSRNKHLDTENISYIQGDAHNFSFLSNMLKETKYNVVVDFMVYTTKEFASRVSTLLSLSDQYVFISSSRVYSNQDEIITEETPRLLDVCEDKDYIFTDEYALTKARQENIIKQSGYHNYTIIRPYITFSETRLQLGPFEKEYWLYRALQGSNIVVSKDFLEKRTTLTYGYDVAKGIASIIGQNDALSNVFHITNNRSYTWKELLDCYIEAIEEKTGIKPKYTVIEKWQKYLGGGAEQVKYDRVYNRVFDNTKIAKYIDINQFQDTKQALKECVYAFIDSQKWGCISPASELKKDKLTGDKTPLPIIKLKLRTRVKLFLVKHNII